MDQQDRRPTLPPEAPTAKSTIEAIGYVHARLDAVQAAADGAKGAAVAARIAAEALPTVLDRRLGSFRSDLGGKLDAVLEVLRRVASVATEIPELRRKVADLETQVAEHARLLRGAAAE